MSDRNDSVDAVRTAKTCRLSVLASPKAMSSSPIAAQAERDASAGGFTAESKSSTRPMLFDIVAEEEVAEWLNTEEAARYLRISVGSLRNLTSNGGVTFYKLFGRNRYHRDDLRRLLKKAGESTNGL